MGIKDYIEYLTETIKTKIKPNRLILFGSHAYGIPNKDSDIDILIEIDTDIKKSKRSIEVSKLFLNREYPLDLIVYTPAEVKSKLSNNDPFLQNIFNKGKVLYERTD